MTVLEFRIEADVARVRFLRADIRDRLEELGVAEGDVDRLVLVVDELVSNSIEHGASYRSEEDVLSIRLTILESHVELGFEDPSVPAGIVAEMLRLLDQCRSGGVPPLDNERGRGLFLIDDGLEDVVVEAGADGSGLELTGRLRRETA